MYLSHGLFKIDEHRIWRIRITIGINTRISIHIDITINSSICININIRIRISIRISIRINIRIRIRISISIHISISNNIRISIRNGISISISITININISISISISIGSTITISINVISKMMKINRTYSLFNSYSKLMNTPFGTHPLPLGVYRGIYTAHRKVISYNDLLPRFLLSFIFHSKYSNRVPLLSPI